MPAADGSPLPVRNRLQHMVLRAHAAIKAAGFKPGAFMPQKDKFRIEVLVPVTFDFSEASAPTAENVFGLLGNEVRLKSEQRKDAIVALPPSPPSACAPAQAGVRRGPGRPRKIV